MENTNSEIWVVFCVQWPGKEGEAGLSPAKPWFTAPCQGIPCRALCTEVLGWASREHHPKPPGNTTKITQLWHILSYIMFWLPQVWHYCFHVSREREKGTVSQAYSTPFSSPHLHSSTSRVTHHRSPPVPWRWLCLQSFILNLLLNVQWGALTHYLVYD